MGGNISVKSFFTAQQKDRLTDISDQQQELSEHEKKVVRSQWPEIDKKSDIVCIDIFCRIFELKPEAKAFFPFKNVDDEALLKHPYFRGHVTRFLNAVRMTIANLDAWEIILIPNLLKLGQEHTKIKGFKHEYFEIFFKAMDYTWNKHLGKTYNSQSRRAWAKIFRLIVSKVEEGYTEGVDNNIHRASQQVAVNPRSDVSNSVCPHHTSDTIIGAAANLTTTAVLDDINSCS